MVEQPGVKFHLLGVTFGATCGGYAQTNGGYDVEGRLLLCRLEEFCADATLEGVERIHGMKITPQQDNQLCIGDVAVSRDPSWPLILRERLGHPPTATSRWEIGQSTLLVARQAENVHHGKMAISSRFPWSSIIPSPWIHILAVAGKNIYYTMHMLIEILTALIGFCVRTLL